LNNGSHIEHTHTKLSATRKQLHDSQRCTAIPNVPNGHYA
jgi:hypothetical protein